MNEMFAAYQRAKAKASTGEFNFLLLRELIYKIESEEFETHAGYLCYFEPWLKVKEILGLIIEDTNVAA